MDEPFSRLPEVEPLLQDARISGDVEERSTPECPSYAKTSVLARYIPEVDPNHARAKTLRKKLSKRSTMLRIQKYVAISVVALNTTALIWFMAKYNVEDARGIGTLYTGGCRNIRIINSVLHVFLNAMSSLFLSASSYCMQVLVAPSRTEIDRAHLRGVSLDIGVPSFRNLWHIQRRRVVIWVLIGMISTLLHLMWNSTIFTSIPFTVFAGAIATSDVLTAHDRWENDTRGIRAANFTNKNFIYSLKDRGINFTRLDKRTCLEQYIDPLQATRDLIVIAADRTSAQNNGSSVIQGWVDGLAGTQWSTATSWICSAYQHAGRQRFCSLDWTLTFVDRWVLRTWDAPVSQKVEVDYCLVDEQGDSERLCGLHFSAPVVGLVCLCALIGSLLIIWTASKHKEPTIMTMGDAIASFLEDPEEMGTYGKDTIIKGGTSDRKRLVVAIKATSWSVARPTSWFRSVSVRNWLLSYLIFFMCLILPSYLLRRALIKISGQGLPIGLHGLWQQGLGKVNAFALINGVWWRADRFVYFARQIFLANIFHLLVSSMYFFVNNILSRQLVAAEWTRLLKPEEKKPLRVSSPQGMQRESYMLSMPFGYSVPLIAVFILMHWLVSQSIFIVQTRAFSSEAGNPRMPTKDASRVGFSAFGIVCIIITEGILVVGLLPHSSIRRYHKVPASFPRMGICSATISAACHPPSADTDAYLFPLSIGVVSEERPGSDGCTERLTLSTYVDLQVPKEGGYYLQPVIVHTVDK